LGRTNALVLQFLSFHFQKLALFFQHLILARSIHLRIQIAVIVSHGGSNLTWEQFQFPVFHTTGNAPCYGASARGAEN
jgi:hypothetical protein